MSELCDKDWMVIEDRSSSGYRTGVDNFIKFAYNNRLRDTPFCICPCRCCRNRKSLSFALVRHDLLVNGILSTYAIWSLHGETSTHTQRSEYLTQENVEHTIVEEETLEKEIVEESHGDDGCRLNEFVDKAFGVYEGLNEDVNVDDSGHPFIQEPNLGKKHDKYKKLAEEKIYPTCENGATTLSVIVELHHVKKRFGWSGNSVTYLLGLLRKWFPEGNTFPAKYPVMKEMLKDMGMKAENIHACVNHCVLFRKDLKDEVECPSCGASRFKFKEGKDGVQVPTKEPALVLRHFPLPERLQKFYTVPWIAEDFTWHDRAEVSVEYMRHPIDSPQWQNMKLKWPEFAKESRNVWLGISTDGFNPRGIQCASYSCWPVILVPYNLPPSLCMKPEFQIMSLLIPGPKQPGQDICVFLQPLIDDLNKLWKGVDAVDMHKKESFQLRAILMWGIHDLPAYGNVSGCSVHGYKACPGCGDETESNWLYHSRKIVYRNFRRFLKSTHPFRKEKHLGLKTVETNLAPARLSGEEVLIKTSGLHYLPGKLTRDGKKRKRDFYDVRKGTISQQDGPTSSSAAPKTLVKLNIAGLPTGPNASKFMTQAGELIIRHIPFNHANWRIVPQKYKDDVWTALMGEYEFEVEHVRSTIEIKFPKCFRRYKSDLRNYYIKNKPRKKVTNKRYAAEMEGSEEHWRGLKSWMRRTKKTKKLNLNVISLQKNGILPD